MVIIPYVELGCQSEIFAYFVPTETAIPPRIASLAVLNGFAVEPTGYIRSSHTHLEDDHWDEKEIETVFEARRLLPGTDK